MFIESASRQMLTDSYYCVRAQFEHRQLITPQKAYTCDEYWSGISPPVRRSIVPLSLERSTPLIANTDKSKSIPHSTVCRRNNSRGRSAGAVLLKLSSFICLNFSYIYFYSLTHYVRFPFDVIFATLGAPQSSRLN